MGKQLLWSLPGNVEAQAAADSAGGNSWELALDLDPKPRLCVYPKTAQTPSLKGGAKREKNGGSGSRRTHLKRNIDASSGRLNALISRSVSMATSASTTDSQ